MDEQLTREDLDGILDAWCADMIRKGWTVDSRAGYTVAVRKSNMGSRFIEGLAVTFVAWCAAAFAYLALPAVVFWALALAGPIYVVYAVMNSVARRTVTVYSDGIVRDN